MGDNMNNKIKSLSEIVEKKNLFPRLIVMTLGFFLLALNYNLFLVRNSLVIGGTSGLAIIINKLFGMEPTTFIYISGIILLIISYFSMGAHETFKNIFGAILFPVFISITIPLANYLSKMLVFDNFILTVLLAGIICGVADALVFKAGFTTGGSDILRQIVNKYMKIPNGKAIWNINIIIILAGGIVFGISKVIYAVLILLMDSLIVDRIVLGISENKMFFIYTRQIDDIKKYIMEDLKTGVTLFSTEGGFSAEKAKMIMCVVSTRDYYRFKQSVLTLDPQAFIVINDCYDVSGGKKKKKFKFI